MFKMADSTTEEIKWREKIGYGLGDAASCLFWKLSGVYLMFFYTDVFGIPAIAVGTMFLITRVWDSFFDPIVGIVADRTESRWGKFRPYLLWVALPFGIIGVLTFFTPDISVFGKIVYAYVTYSLMMMVYSLINVPYSCLLGVISFDVKTRNILSSYKMIFAFVGSLLALWIIEPLVKYFGNGSMTSRHGWSMAVIVFAVITVILFWVCFFSTKERVKPIKEEKTPLLQDLKDLSTNWPWWILLGAGIAVLIFNSVRDGSAIYYFKYFIQPSNNSDFHIRIGATVMSVSLATLYFILGQASNIIGVIIAIPIANKLGKKNTYLSTMLIASILSVGFYFFNADTVVLVMIFQCLISICAGIIFPLLWSMYADIADYSEWKSNRRATGLIFSSSSMSQKIGWTIGGASTGWFLGYFGFHANAIQAGTTLIGIKCMMSFLPAIGSMLSVIIIIFYPLSEKKLADIIIELNHKRRISAVIK